jgi:ATP-dependent Clp protease ATP-binding subunit ClpA
VYPSKPFIRSTAPDAPLIKKKGRQMFERFTESSRAVLVQAQDLAIELESSTIEVVHMLYGCAQGREETAGKPLHDGGITGASIRQFLPGAKASPQGPIDPSSLEALGIDFNAVQRSVDSTFGPGALDHAPDRRNAPANRRKPTFSVDAKRSLEQSLHVALELHEKKIAPGHILLGILRLNDDEVSRVVASSRTTFASLSSNVLARLANL